MRENEEGTEKAGWVFRPQCKCDHEWRRVEGKLGACVLDLVQSKVGLSRPLGALEPLGRQRSPVTPGFSWNSLALLSSIFLHSYLFHAFPTTGLEHLGFLPSSLMAQMVKNLSAMQRHEFIGWGDPLEKGMATLSSVILAWRIPWTQKPGGLLFIGSQRVGHDRATNTFFLSLWKRGFWNCFRL